jgi:hypothetical protein
MEHSKEQMLRNYAWCYFSYHADQRMKTFNFFLILAGFIAGGILTLLKDLASPWIITPLGMTLTYLCVLFTRLDHRNHVLVQNGEAALKHLDSHHNTAAPEEEPSVVCIFDRDDFRRKGLSRFIFKRGYFSYSQVIRHVYVLFGILGMYLAILPFFRRQPTIAPASVIVTAMPNLSVTLKSVAGINQSKNPTQ